MPKRSSRVAPEDRKKHYIGSDAEFDTKVALEALLLLLDYKEYGWRPPVYSDIVRKLNETDLVKERGTSLQRANTRGYVHSLLEVLEQEGLITISKNEARSYAGTNTYAITDAGVKLCGHSQGWQLPEKRAVENVPAGPGGGM